MAEKKSRVSIDHYASPELIRYYDMLKITKRVQELAKFIGKPSASTMLSNIMSHSQPLPLETAIKIVAFSNYELYLGDIAPYIKPYLSGLAQQQLRREQERKNERQPVK